MLRFTPDSAQAGIARRLRRRVQPRLQLRHPCPQRQDQRVLLGPGEPARIGRRPHSGLKPPPPDAVNGADFPPRLRPAYTGDEQSRMANGHQRYRCKACGRSFTATPARGKPPAMKALAVLLYALGNVSQGMIAKLL